jgi:hypothetical protein
MLCTHIIERFRIWKGVTRRAPLVEQELLTLQGQLSSPPVFSGVRVTLSLVLYVCFVDRCFRDLRFLITPLVSSDYSCKKSLKIPKGQSESIYWRRTDNTMAKRKSIKRNVYWWKVINEKISSVVKFRS